MVTAEGQCFSGTRCEELGDQLVPEARSYNQSKLPHLTSGDLNALFPKATACKEEGGEDPPEDTVLEERGLRRVREAKEKKEEQQGSTKNSSGHFVVKKKDNVISLIRCDECGLY